MYATEKNDILLQQKELPSCNVVTSTWMCCAYPNLFFEIDLKERMAQELDRFTKFHLQVRNYCPNSRFPLRTRVWFLRMDKEAYKERFGQFSEIFHYGNDITIVPYHGFKTWDTNSISLKQLVIQHNE